MIFHELRDHELNGLPKEIRLASVGILEKEREPGVGKLGYLAQNPMCGFFF